MFVKSQPKLFYSTFDKLSIALFLSKARNTLAIFFRVIMLSETIAFDEKPLYRWLAMTPNIKII